MSELFELECGYGGGESPPPDMYDPCEFLGMEYVPPSPKADGEDWGEAVRLRFKVLEGKHAGKIASGTGPIKPTDKNRTGKILASMGFSLAPGTKVSVRDLIGKRFNVVVGISKGGKPVVEYAYPSSKK